MPVLTDESESKKSSFLSWQVFCWLTVDAIWEFFWCWCNSKVSNLSSHCDTLSNLSYLDDSRISTFFTINFVVLLLVSILAICRSCKPSKCTNKIQKLIGQAQIFSNFCVSINIQKYCPSKNTRSPKSKKPKIFFLQEWFDWRMILKKVSLYNRLLTMVNSFGTSCLLKTYFLISSASLTMDLILLLPWSYARKLLNNFFTHKNFAPAHKKVYQYDLAVWTKWFKYHSNVHSLVTSGILKYLSRLALRSYLQNLPKGLQVKKIEKNKKKVWN